MEDEIVYKQKTGVCYPSADGFDESCVPEGGVNMKSVSDWVRRSVLFWNQSDQQQDGLSLDGDGSDDAQEQVLNGSGYLSNNRTGSKTDNQSDNSSIDQEKVIISNPEESEEGLPNNSHLTKLCDSPAEPTNILDGEQRANANEMIVDVENIQKLFIEPFIMGEEKDKACSYENCDNESPYYTLNFPKYAEHVYSPLYEEHVGLRNEKRNPQMKGENDWNIAERLNRLIQTRGQLMSNVNSTGINERDTGELLNGHGDEMERRSVDSDIFKAIKKVQDTLGEIADELETTRLRKSSRDKDPNLILINLLSRIQPPVDRDSYAYSPTEDASQIGQDLKDLLKSSAAEEGTMSNPENKGDIATEQNLIEGGEDDFDVFKELSDPNKSTEEVLQEFMQKLSSTSKPSSAIRGLLKRISEEITSDVSGDLDHHEGAMLERKSPVKKPSCQIIVEHESGTEFENMNEHVHGKSNCDAGNIPSERRISSVSGMSSLPTSPSATNYDSGFSELTKGLSYTRKENLASFLPDESTKRKMERRLKEAFEKTKSGFDSETSTDWSPCSTLSNTDTAFKKTTGLKHSPFQRVTPRRRSTGMTNSKQSGFKLQPGNTNSCPNFDRGNSLTDPAKGYTKAEVEAIRKFLSLTSLYFGCKGTMPIQNDTYDELMQRGDLDHIHNVLKQQKDDLEKQRWSQEELYNRLGEMLLQLVTLKDEHVISTQKQTKALTLLKKQLDIQKKEQQRAQETIKEQISLLKKQFTPGVDDKEISRLESIPRALSEKHTGQIIWKITGITRKVTRIHAGSSDNVSISDPFYSGPYGYKMAAWVYLNGRADYRGKGISVYVCPLCGEYDAILPWPIKPIYTFTLIDQNPDPSKNRNHVKVRNIIEISKKGETALSSKGGIPRPQQGSKSFIVGFDDFISQSELASSKYIVEDTMFLKVNAEIN